VIHPALKRELLRTAWFSGALVVLGIVFLTAGWERTGLHSLFSAFCLSAVALLFWSRSWKATSADEPTEEQFPPSRER
jgi:drug/metabolite transporter (DMT)-like permease